MWRNDQRPRNIDATEDDDVVFECNVIGRPNPTVTLMYDAQPLQQGTYTLHRRDARFAECIRR